jgi:hypothetical protein
MAATWGQKSLYWRFALVVLGVLLLVGKATLSPMIYGIADEVLANVPKMDDGMEYPPTAQFLAPSTFPVQLVGGLGAGIGCSIPAFVIDQIFDRDDSESTIDLQMRQACAFHDYCYRHGRATYGYTQADCDSMLQQHSFRLCRFNTRASEDKQKNCQTRARLIVLGVRTRGATSFLTDRSTPFEFDPYPGNTQGYTVYRIADASPRAIAAGVSGKSLYGFRILNGTTSLFEVGWTSNGVPRELKAIILHGQFGRLTTPPMILQSSNGEDVFLWWQRNTLSSTAGRFFAIVPGRANEADWAHYSDPSLDPSIRSKEQGRNRNTCTQDIRFERISFVRSAWAHTQEIDCYISEFQTARVAVSADYQPSVSVFGLRTVSCYKGGTVHCYMHSRIIFNGSNLILRNMDDINRFEGMRARNGDFDRKQLPREEDRYRAFVSAPVMEEGSRPIIHFYKRGDGRGHHFRDELVVRRFSTLQASGTINDKLMGEKKWPYTAASQGRVILRDLQENDEPQLLFTFNGTSHYLTYGHTEPAAAFRWVDASTLEAKPVLKLWTLPNPKQEGFEMELADRNALFKIRDNQSRAIQPAVVKRCPSESAPLTILKRPYFAVVLKGGDIALTLWEPDFRFSEGGMGFLLSGIRIHVKEACYTRQDKFVAFALLPTITSGLLPRFMLMPADIDGDGKLDVIAIDRDKNIRSKIMYDVERFLWSI